MKAKPVGGWDELETAGPGAFIWATHGSEDPAQIIFNCPGCGNVGGCPVVPGAHDGKPAWTFDGHRESPTLTPSIRMGCCGWHGFLTAGEFVAV
jgi:hypothetical protein